MFNPTITYLPNSTHLMHGCKLPPNNQEQPVQPPGPVLVGGDPSRPPPNVPPKVAHLFFD